MADFDKEALPRIDAKSPKAIMKRMKRQRSTGQCTKLREKGRRNSREKKIPSDATTRQNVSGRCEIFRGKGTCLRRISTS